MYVAQLTFNVLKFLRDQEKFQLFYQRILFDQQHFAISAHLSVIYYGWIN